MENPERSDRYKELASKWLEGTITPGEAKEYADWYNYEEETPLNIPGSFAKSEQELEVRMLANIMPVKGKISRLQPLTRIAAAIVLILGLGTITLFILKPGEPVVQVASNDILPAQGGVTLVFGNGSTIMLDTVYNGKLSADYSQDIIKNENSISYADNKSIQVAYNTISTSKGKTYMLQLADGSKIWLDAESSVRFPNTFPGKERVVEVNGQVYLDVNKNANKPFKVIAGKQTIEVLGTEFNVNNYTGAARTTLINGKVKIKDVILKPFEQAVSENDKILVQKNTDIEAITAWKNGQFRFNGTSLQEIMQQLKRWYDIEVEYENKIPEMQLVAKINRDMPISKILNLLELTGQVKFIIDKNKIKVVSIKK